MPPTSRRTPERNYIGQKERIEGRKREKVKEGLDKCIYVDLPLKLGNNLLKQEALSSSAEDHGCLRKHKQERIL